MKHNEAGQEMVTSLPQEAKTGCNISSVIFCAITSRLSCKTKDNLCGFINKTKNFRTLRLAPCNCTQLPQKGLSKVRSEKTLCPGESLILERRSWSNKSVFNDFSFFNAISS